MSIASAIPPVIEVVTGADWPAIITAIVTGLAALAGIGGTAYLAYRASNDAKKSLKAAADQLVTSINAEDKRAHTAEKRRIYASTVTAMNEAMIAAVAYRVACEGSDDEERKAAMSREKSTTEGMYRAMGELFLIASHPVVDNAVALQSTQMNFMKESNTGPPFTDPEARVVSGALDTLVRSMREDLGEPVGATGNQKPPG